MKENVKLGILGAVALLTLVNTYQISTLNDNTVVAQPSSTVAATPANNALPAPVEPVADIAKTTFEFPETEYDFGKINQDSENRKVFAFTNTGSEPLIIEKAVGSCGCTVPNYPKEPIAPGKSAEIEVIYKPGKQKGNQSKTVTITANTDPKNTMLYIKADVQEI